MKKQYLHLAVYRCDNCEGPVVSGSVAVRENEIAGKTGIRELGAKCLSCGHGQDEAEGQEFIRRLPPIDWQPVGVSLS